MISLQQQNDVYLLSFRLWLRYEEPFHISEPTLFLSHTRFTVAGNEEIQLSFFFSFLSEKMIWSMQRKGRGGKSIYRGMHVDIISNIFFGCHS